MNTKDVFDIKISILHMQAPAQLDDNMTKRVPLIKNKIVENIISSESFLRRAAYENTTIKTDNSFFDDSDMTSEYYLVVVYENNSNTPLLSSRYYFNKLTIAKYLKGDNNTETDLTYNGEKFILDNYKEGDIFLADRLSGNVTNAIYRQYRNQIFMLFYSEVVNTNKNCMLLLMVRKEKYDKQLSKYLKIGFVLIGSTIHKGKEHSIVLGDFKTSPIQC